jgi:hypothetical protein
MFILAKLVFEHYIPETLEKGMWFKQRIKDVIYGRIYEYDRIFQSSAPALSQEEFDSFVSVHGYPVKPRIMSITANPDEPAVTLATAEQIGWWDEDPSSDEMRDIELKDINMVLSDYDSEIEIEIDDSYITSLEDDEIIVPILYMDKVTLSYPGAHDEYYDDYDDDWDDMDDWTDDEPDTDSAGFTEDDRIVNGQYRATLEQDEQRYNDRHKQDSCPKYDSDHETE